MFEKKQFELTEQHIKLIRRMYVDWNCACEFGAPTINPNVPYGNGDIYGDIAEILEIKPALIKNEENIYSEEQEEEMLILHEETKTALQVILAAGSFEPGIYEVKEYHINWKKKA